MLQAVREWREQAWRNAERLVNAKTDEDRKQVADSIDAYAEGVARGIVAANTVPGYGKTRDAYCRKHNTIEREPGGGHAGRSTLSLSVRIYNTGTRRLGGSGRLGVKVKAGGPGAIRLRATLRGRRIGSRTVRFRAAGTKRIALKLTRRGRRAVRTRRRARVKVSARLLDRAGRTRSARTAKTLRRR